MAQLVAHGPQLAIQPLQKDTFPVWLYSVRAFAREHDLIAHLDGDVPIPENEADAKPILKKQALAGRLVLGSLGSDIQRELGKELTPKTPHGILLTIAELVAADESPEEQDRLQRKAQTTKIKSGESSENYLKATQRYDKR